MTRDGRRHRIGDPRRVPGWVVSSLRAPVGSPLTKARLMTYALRAATTSPATLTTQPDSAALLALQRAGIRARLLETTLRPFLAGVLGEAELATSRRFLDLALLAFLRGTPGVPTGGMGEIPRQLAARLPDAALLTRARVEAVTATIARTAEGEHRARAVVVATDPVTAARLVPGLPEPRMHALTTFYHLADEPPTHLAALHVDGHRRGPVLNTSVISNVAPTYAPPDRHLVSSTVLGDRDDAATERSVRAQLALIYGRDTRRWEHVRTYAIPHALPAMPPPLNVRKAVAVAGLVVAGDHRDTSSIQGAMVSGRRAAGAVLDQLKEKSRAS